ncbi:MAG: hypothetical protein J7623_26700 [Chitinophaga sp.]|uniref:hypothetical protein n=1 Tax=Chitinophaga sp. TaxID=1869181 RepID=UPI001B0F89C2|nr:hypothetical protein [Chitinophaga sp.]MBO9732260.1 hypothetical protein [Chitinophaga sp.]
MDEQKDKINEYFGSPENYCWQWTDNGEFIDWNTDLTICYADELIPVLEEISIQGWPPLGSILLVLIACKEDGKHIPQVKQVIQLFLEDIKEPQNFQHEELKRLFETVLPFLHLISELPRECRTGKNRTLLLKSIFADIPPAINRSQTKYLLTFYYKHNFRRQQENHVQLKQELVPLAMAARQIKNKEALESILRTSLEQAPAPAPVDLTLPEPDLISQLITDQETAGIGHIAQRILASLHIPIHSQPEHDQSLGGISDISNKGSYDRLLLSELAQEDHMLMARIAHNEALYLKREALSSNPRKDRVMLIDASLKMWGKPRVFAIAAALACMQYDKKHTNLIAYTLKGNTAVPADLHHKKGVLAALSVLDNHLHSGEALEALLQKEKPGQADYYLITSEELMQQPAFLQAVVRQQAKLSCLITVNRNGQFRLYQYSKGRKKLCNEALLDLDELLFKPAAKQANTASTSIKDLPEILLQQSLPLRFPASRLKRQINYTYQFNEGVVCITSDQRLLYWPNQSKGAIELCTLLEEGNYTFGADGKDRFSILVNNYNKDFCYLHIFTPRDTGHIITQTSVPTGAATVIYQDKYFHLQSSRGMFAVSCDGQPGGPLHKDAFNKYLLEYGRIAQKNVNDVFRFVRQGYSTLSKIKSLYVDANDQLVIGNWQLKIDHLQRIRLSDKSIKIDDSKLRDVVTHTFAHPANPNIVFTRFEFPGGVIATADSRGLLHLRTDNHSLSEVLLTVIIDMQLTCWASDKYWAGHEYFIHDTDSQHVWDRDFYHQYLQPYIDRIKCP